MRKPNGYEKRPEKEEGRFAVIILAAGKGNRMKSDLAKVLHPLCGAPMLSYPVDAARRAGSGKIVVVVGHQAQQIRDQFDGQGLIFAEQRELLGTGHAVLQTAGLFRDHGGAVLILCGDVPLILPRTIKSLYERHCSERAAVTILTAVPEDPAGYGRVIKAEEGNVLKIVEERDATPEEKKVCEINTGIYCAESDFLFAAVAALGNRNAQGEYYLTDIVEMANQRGLRANALAAADPVEVMGINTPEELERAGRFLASRNLSPAVVSGRPAKGSGPGTVPRRHDRKGP